MTRPTALLAASLTLCAGLSGISAALAAGFKTPEAAVTAYMEGVAAHSLHKILAATAVDEMSTNFDFVAFVDRLKSLVPTAPAPADDPMFAAINKATYTAAIARQVQFLTYGLLTTEPVGSGEILEMDGAGAQAFEKQLDLTRLDALKLDKVDVYSASMIGNQKYKDNIARQAKTYGADELADRVALVSFEGAHYLVGFTLLRYGDEWGVAHQTSSLAGTSVTGTPVPLTLEEFEDRLNE